MAQARFLPQRQPPRGRDLAAKPSAQRARLAVDVPLRERAASALEDLALFSAFGRGFRFNGHLAI